MLNLFIVLLVGLCVGVFCFLNLREKPSTLVVVVERQPEPEPEPIVQKDFGSIDLTASLSLIPQSYPATTSQLVFSSSQRSGGISRIETTNDPLKFVPSQIGNVQWESILRYQPVFIGPTVSVEGSLTVTVQLGGSTSTFIGIGWTMNTTSFNTIAEAQFPNGTTSIIMPFTHVINNTDLIMSGGTIGFAAFVRNVGPGNVDVNVTAIKIIVTEV